MLKEFLARIKLSIPNPQIVIFLRKQSALAASLYSLYIQKGGTYKASKFLNPETRLQALNLFSKEYLDYQPILEHIVTEFGKKNVSVYLYEDFVDTPTPFLEKLIKQHNFQVNIEDINYNVVNAGLSSKQLSIKRFLNHFTGYGIPFKHYFFHLPGINTFLKSGRKSTINVPELFDSIQHEYSQSNQWIMDNFDLPQMQKFGYCE